MFELFLYHIHFYLLNSILHSSTTEAEEINRLHFYFLWAASFVLLVVTVATIYVIYKYRHHENGQEYQPKTLSGKWEIAMIGVPLAMVVVFFFLMLKTMHHILPSADGKKPDVVITGHQYWWEAQYPGTRVTAANEIHLPVGRTILLKLLSADVIHDWWVPQFGNKMDLISGRQNYLWLNIKEPGIYTGACSEFCGAQHAGMRIRVVAQQESEYIKWLQEHQQVATISDTLAQSGAQIFQSETCGNCHNINGTASNGKAGPDLSHIASRQTLLTGILENNKENLTRWIQDPQKIKPGAHMPKFFLDKHSIDALVAYLSSLK